jgi:hypothetical protein
VDESREPFAVWPLVLIHPPLPVLKFAQVRCEKENSLTPSCGNDAPPLPVTYCVLTRKEGRSTAPQLTPVGGQQYKDRVQINFSSYRNRNNQRLPGP